MDPERHQQVKELFLAAINQPRERWGAFLEERAGQDAELRREVQLLLDFHVGVDGSVPPGPGGENAAGVSSREDDATRSFAQLPRAVEESQTGAAGPARVSTGATTGPGPGGVGGGSGGRGRSGSLARGESTAPERASRSSLHIEPGRFLPGMVIAERYRIVALIGKGGMGEVYRADDLKLGQPVALKFLPPALASNPKRLEQFMNEVRVARQVSHHNVCRVYDIGEHGDEQFISMEYVDGETLDSLVSRIGRLPERKAIQLGQELCAALAAIHDAGILHRDLKPANIMIDGRGQLRLTDFGLASARELHGFEAAAGTPGFVAPEALAGREATVSSDVYTLGLVLYELFTGVPAYKPGPARTVLHTQETTDPPAPSTQAPDLSPEVERAIMSCLAREPADRPKSVRDVSAMLPGGDPLAAALAAGITPSPELVAASGAHGRVSPLRACAALALFAALLVAGRWLQGRVGLLSLAPLPKSPEVLADHAESIVARLGYASPAADSHYELDVYDEYIAELAGKDKSADRWKRLHRWRPAPIDFWYRRSPEPIATLNPMGWISWEDPPDQTPGMISVRLTPRGTLRELVVVDEQLFWHVRPEDARKGSEVREAAAPIEPDWGRLFEAAGLDVSKFQRVEAVRIPAVYADTRAAWVGSYPESPDEPVRIEAAGLRGRPVSFRTVEVNWPQAQNFGAVVIGGEHPRLTRLYEIMIGAVTVTAIITGLVFARINLRLKRSDRTGAMRVGYGLFVVTMVSLLGSADTLAAWSPWYSPIKTAIAASIAVAVCFGISYVAIEPYVRRIWPETIIAWTRLLSGQVFDPLIGQSLLAGSIMGVLGVAVLGLRSLIMPMFGHPPPEPLFDYDYGVEALGSTRQAVGMMFEIVAIAMAFAVVFTLILVLSRIALKKNWAAVGLGAVVYGTMWSAKFHSSPWSSPETWVLFTLGGVVCGLVLVRFGVLALATGAYVYYLLKIFPYPIEDAWYANMSIAALVVACAIAVLGGAIAVFGSSRTRMFGLAPAPTRATV